MISIAERLQKVRQRIKNATDAAGRPEGSVSLLAVSKQRTAAEIATLASLGVARFGENYVSEARGKMQALAETPEPGPAGDIEWHFIGPLQSNKTRQVASDFAWVHSIDREKIARRLSNQRRDGLAPLNLCLQVNLDDEPTKAGVAPEQVVSLADSILGLPRLRLRGLMAIPDPTLDEPALSGRFRQLSALLDELRDRFPDQALDTLSMGMSGDLETAIAEGATIVRVGTALFGPRETF